MQINTRCMLVGLALAIVLSFAPDSAHAEAKKIGKIFTASGEASVVRGKSELPLKAGDAIYEHDVFVTKAKSKLAITFTDSTSFAVGPSSRIAIDTYFFDPKNLKGSMLAKIKKGTMMVRTGKLTKNNPGSIRIKTPRTVLGVRGTTFVVTVDE